MVPQIDFDERPFIAIWETTQACDLACVHCRACAQPMRSSDELTTAEAKKLIDEIAAMAVPVFVLTGGDPLKRPDIFEIVSYAAERNVRISLTPSATPLLTREAIVRLKEAGLARLAVSLDGPTAEIHDAFRRVAGSFQWTMDAVRWAREISLPVQINTTITRHNFGQIHDVIKLLESLDITLWSVFLSPLGAGRISGCSRRRNLSRSSRSCTRRHNARCSILRVPKLSTIGATCCSAARKHDVSNLCPGNAFRNSCRL